MQSGPQKHICSSTVNKSRRSATLSKVAPGKAREVKARQGKAQGISLSLLSIHISEPQPPRAARTAQTHTTPREHAPCHVLFTRRRTHKSDTSTPSAGPLKQYRLYTHGLLYASLTPRPCELCHAFVSLVTLCLSSPVSHMLPPAPPAQSTAHTSRVHTLDWSSRTHVPHLSIKDV